MYTASSNVLNVVLFVVFVCCVLVYVSTSTSSSSSSAVLYSASGVLCGVLFVILQRPVLLGVVVCVLLRPPVYSSS